MLEQQASDDNRPNIRNYRVDQNHHYDYSSRHNDTNDNQCSICSFMQTYPSVPIPIYHRHFSTIKLRDLLGVEESGLGYLCPTCKSRHRPYIDERLRVVVSDSTLHDLFSRSDARYGQYEGDLVHADYITIKGGTIPDLLHAFKLEYAAPKKPLDVIVVAGYADIDKQYSREYIMRGFSEFAASVLGTKEHPSPTKNTFAVSSLMYPPRHCWFLANGPEPYRYHNIVDKFDWLNTKIHELNVKNNVTAYPSFLTYGTRKSIEMVKDDDGKEQLNHIRAHRWEHWQEQARRDKVTLRVDRLYKLAKAVNNYLLYRT